MTLAAFALAVLAQAGAETAPPWVEEPPSALPAPELSPPAPAQVEPDAPTEHRLLPESEWQEQSDPRAAPVTNQRIGRFFGAAGLAALFGTFGSGGYAATPFGISVLNLYGGACCFGATTWDAIAGLPGGGALIPLFMAAAPASLYPKASGRHFRNALLGSFLPMLVGGGVFTLLMLGGGSYLGLTMLSLIVPLVLVLSSLGAGLGYELTEEDDAPARRTRNFSLWTGAVTSMALGFGVAGPVGALGSLLMVGCATCTGELSIPVYAALAVAPLAFGLGPLLTYDRKSVVAYFAGVGASAVSTAVMTLVWGALQRLANWVGSPGLAVGVAAAQLSTAMVPGLMAALFYDLALGPDPEETEEVPVARRALGWDVVPAFGFDGKRGMVGVTVTLP